MRDFKASDFVQQLRVGSLASVALQASQTVTGPAANLSRTASAVRNLSRSATPVRLGSGQSVEMVPVHEVERAIREARSAPRATPYDADAGRSAVLAALMADDAQAHDAPYWDIGPASGDSASVPNNTSTDLVWTTQEPVIIIGLNIDAAVGSWQLSDFFIGGQPLIQPGTSVPASSYAATTFQNSKIPAKLGRLVPGMSVTATLTNRSGGGLFPMGSLRARRMTPALAGAGGFGFWQ